MNTDKKWVACWGNATSITDRREAVYAKDITLRYPVRMCFSGTMLRFRFSNLTGTEPVTLAKVFVGHTPITFGGEVSVTLHNQQMTLIRFYRNVMESLGVIVDEEHFRYRTGKDGIWHVPILK